MATSSSDCSPDNSDDNISTKSTVMNDENMWEPETTVLSLGNGLFRVFWEFTEDVHDPGCFQTTLRLEEAETGSLAAQEFQVTLRRSMDHENFMMTSNECRFKCCEGPAHRYCLHPHKVWLEFGDEHLYPLVKDSPPVQSWSTLVTESGARTTLVLFIDFGKSPGRTALRLGEFFDRQEFCDVTFKFECGAELKAHRAILAASSTYFIGMFSSGMSETVTGVIPLRYVQYAVFKEAVHFLYKSMLSSHFYGTCELGDLQTLTEFAHQHNMTALVDHCVTLILTRLQPSNVFELHVWATGLHLEAAMQATADYMTEHSADMIRAPGMQQLVAENASLFLAVMKKVTNKQA